MCMTLHNSWVMASSWKSGWLLVQPSSAVLLQADGQGNTESRRELHRREGKERSGFKSTKAALSWE